MPFGNHRGFIEVGTEVRRHLYIAQSLLKMQVHRRRVYRVTIQNQQPINLACLYVIN